MPPRNPELPEGTDHIINGAMDPNANRAGAGGGGLGGGGTAASTTSTGSSGGTTTSGIGTPSGLGGGMSSGQTGQTGTTTTSAGTGSTGSTGGSTSNIGGGFVASSGSDDTGGTSTGSGGGSSGAAQKIASGVRSQVNTLTDQATGKMREYADQGKDRATSTLDDFAQVINDAARSIDERLGSQYGEYAHRAAGAVTSFSETIRGKTVDELLDDSRSLVRKSPGVAIGAAALVGFTLVRLVKAGLDTDGEVQFTADKDRNVEFRPDTGGTSSRSS